MESENTIKTVAVYGRVSTANQEEQETILSQLSAVREHAAKNGYTIVREYLDEGWSGDVIVRPALDQLRIDAKRRLWDAVLIYDPDRLARRYAYQELVMDELRELDIATLFVTVSAPKSEDDKMLYGMRGLFSQYERLKIAERFRIGKVRKAKEGHIVASEAPYGYTLVVKKGERGEPDFTNTHYEINESEARVVRMVFSWVASEGLTIRKVVARLRELSILPRKSKRGVWNTSTLNTMLRNRTYIGEGHYGASYAVVPVKPLKTDKYRKVKKTSRRIKPESEWIKIKTPVILEGAEGTRLFEQAQQQLVLNFQQSQRNKKNEYLLAGKIRCVCGRSRAGEGPKRGKYLYYRCTSRVHSFPLPSPCDERGVNSRIADELVWSRIFKLMGSKDLMIGQTRRWMNSRRDRSRVVTVDAEGMKKELAQLRKKHERFVLAYSEGIFSASELQGYTGSIKQKIHSLETQIAKADTPIATEAEQVADEKAIESYAERAAAMQDLSFEEKRVIVLKTVDRIEASQKQLQVYGRIPVTNYVKFQTSDRYRRAAQCREIDAF